MNRLDSIREVIDFRFSDLQKEIDYLRVENKQEISNYIIDNFNLLDLTFKSNEPTIDLSTYGSLKHNTQTLNSSALYTEYCVLPTKSLQETYDIYYTTFDTAWNDFIEANKQKASNDFSIIVTGLTYTSLINNPTHQINFANMIANKSYSSIRDIPNNITSYTTLDINSLLLTKPLIKEDGITIVIEVLDPKINPKEEIVLTVDLVIGAGALYKFGTIKELEITGLLEINVYKEDIGLEDMKKITVPIKINLK